MPQTLPLKPLGAISTLERSEKILSLSKSLLHAIKNQDVWEVVDILTRIRPYTQKSQDRHLLLLNGVTTTTMIMMNPKFYKYERLMIECTWILASVASEGSIFVKHVMETDTSIIQKALDLMRHPNNEVKQNVVWLLTIIAGESFENRDKLLELKVVKQIELLLQSVSPRRSLISNVASLIAQLVRGKYCDPFTRKRTYPDGDVEPLIKYLGYIVNKTNHKEIIITASRALYDLVEDMSFLDFGSFFEPEIYSKMLPLLKDTDPETIIIGEKIIIEILFEGDYNLDHLDAFVENGLIEALYELLKHPDARVRETACLGLGPIYNTNSDMAQKVLDFKDGQIIKDLMEICLTDEPKVVESCVEIFRFVFYGVPAEIVYRLISLAVLKFYCEVLEKLSESQLIESVLEGMEEMLNAFSILPDNGRLNKAGVVKLIKLYKGDVLVKQFACNEKFKNSASKILRHLST